MKKIIPILFVVLVLVLVGVSIYTISNYNNNISKAAPSPTPTTPAPEQASPSPQIKHKIDFTLKDLNGKDVSIHDFTGKKIYVNFWATWCSPCKSEMPELEKLYQETKDSDLVIIAVNLGDSKETVQAFMNQNNYHFTVLLDSDNAIASKYGITGIPTSIFLDREGYLVDGMTGAMSYDNMRSYIDKLK